VKSIHEAANDHRMNFGFMSYTSTKALPGHKNSEKSVDKYS
jgi:hypothetical protein